MFKILKFILKLASYKDRVKNASNGKLVFYTVMHTILSIFSFIFVIVGLGFTGFRIEMGSFDISKTVSGTMSSVAGTLLGIFFIIVGAICLLIMIVYHLILLIIALKRFINKMGTTNLVCSIISFIDIILIVVLFIIVLL